MKKNNQASSILLKKDRFLSLVCQCGLGSTREIVD